MGARMAHSDLFAISVIGLLAMLVVGVYAIWERLRQR
jgi:hypothetical protein